MCGYKADICYVIQLENRGLNKNNVNLFVIPINANFLRINSKCLTKKSQISKATFAWKSSFKFLGT